jgi:transposase-like protein
MGEKRRHFSREFKRDAVQLVTEKGMAVGKGRVTPEEAEIKGLQKKLEKVRQERGILEKTFALFSKQNK